MSLEVVKIKKKKWLMGFDNWKMFYSEPIFRFLWNFVFNRFIDFVGLGEKIVEDRDREWKWRWENNEMEGKKCIHFFREREREKERRERERNGLWEVDKTYGWPFIIVKG